MIDPLLPGIYESVLTSRLQQQLVESELDAEFEHITEDDEPHVYARHIAAVVERHLRSVNKSERRDAANAIINRLIDGEIDSVARSEMLGSLHPAGRPAPVRPATPLSDVALLTNSHDPIGRARRHANHQRGSRRPLLRLHPARLRCMPTRGTARVVLEPRLPRPGCS